MKYIALGVNIHSVGIERSLINIGNCIKQAFYIHFAKVVGLTAALQLSVWALEYELALQRRSCDLS